MVTLIVAIAQAYYAFAPAFFGGVRALSDGPHSELLTLTLAAGIQGLAVLALIRGVRSSIKNN
ncbi:hypothetical protein [Pseudomonas syringae group genomosp. 3]|uniref:hypothetical protein n=1 Tax=Pseudomonas syringae group genomosp. 3 TaxID=251701 RepID=UPI0021800B20|nr:hypothetical protein [Pseudomonas syringae group genomosp. 3]